MAILRKANVQYLIQEAVLILAGSYLLFFGGTHNGLVLPRIVWVTLGLVGGVSLVWLGWRAWRRRWIETPPLWLPVVAVALAYVLTGFTSLDSRRSLDALWVLALEIWVFLLVYDLVKCGWPAELFVKVLLLLGAIIVAFACGQLLDWERQWLAIAGRSASFPPIWPRPAPFYAHANLTAAVVNLLWPLALVWLWNTHSWLTRLWCGLLIVGCVVVNLFSSSRGALLAAGGALVLTLLLAVDWRPRTLVRFRQRLGRWWWAVVVVVVVVVAGVGMVGARLSSHPTHGPFWESRSQFWSIAIATFRQTPLVGSGPGTFASDYMQRLSVPPNPLYLHPHSLLMSLAAEMGLVGLAAVAWLAVALVWAAYRRWRVAQPVKRIWIAGLCGALATLGLHSFVDVPTAVPAIAAVAMALLALLLAEPSGSPERAAPHFAGTYLVTLAALFFVGAGVWMQRACTPYFCGAAWANMGEWQKTLPLLDEATRRDPSHAYYRLQAGFAYGMAAAEGDESALTQAIAHYRQGTMREPYYSVNHANLAVLLWQQGDQQAAIAEMQRAAELAPQEAAYPLNLGVFCETQGDAARSAKYYERALTLRPGWAAAYFWRASAVRQAALQVWQATQPAHAAPFALDAIQADNAAAALAHFDQVVRESPANPSAHLGRAVALIALARWDEAAQALRVADFCARGGGAAVPGEMHNDIVYYQAVVAVQQDHSLDAIHTLEQALGEVRNQSLFGPAGEGAALYGWGVFYRVGWGSDTLPGLQIIRFTDTQVERLFLLGQWYESAGDMDAARRVYREVLEVSPDATAATERLAVLDSPGP